MIILSREKDKDMFIKFAEEHNKKIDALEAGVLVKDPDLKRVIKDLLSNCRIYSVGNNKWDIFIKYKGDME